MRALLVGTILIVACGGARTSPPAQPQPAQVATVPATRAPEVAPDEGECDALFAHVVALGVSESHNAQLAPEDATRVQGEVRARYLASCRAMSREAYRCAVAAPSLAAVDACSTQPTRSSSTSNSSVEFAGITPGTPRAP